MPGVPTGKACDACRKSKKKCDEKQPVCSRCGRLKLKCVGGGIQRYKFKNTSSSAIGTTVSKRTNLLHHGDDVRIAQWTAKRGRESTVTTMTTTPSPLFSPTNEHTRLISAFVSIINSSTDLRYNLWWSYGIFFEDVPQRLGSNRALDCAIDAVISTHAGFCSRQPISAETLSKYSRALRALRVCLDDPASVHSSNTLCAILVLLICQFFIAPAGDYSPWSSHAEGAAHILVARGDVNPRDDFERKLVFALSASVLCEALLNDRIQLTPQPWETLVRSNINPNIPEGHTLLLLSRAPDVMQRGRHALRLQHDVTDLRNETQALYESCKVNNDVFRNRLIDDERGPSATSTSLQQQNPFHPDLMTNHYQRSYAFALVVSIAFNRILSALDPNHSSSLDLESTSFAYEILGVSMQTSSMCRPIGSGFLMLCLGAAWVGTTDAQLRLLLETLLADYQQDFRSWPQYQPRVLERMARHMRLSVSFLQESFVNGDGDLGALDALDALDAPCH